MMSGAWPPPEPSVWNEWIVRPSNAAIVSSTKPDSFSVSVCMHTCTSISSATVSAERSTAGVVPQSSWHLKPTAPASICSTSAALPCAVALAEDADVDRPALEGAQHVRDVARARA